MSTCSYNATSKRNGTCKRDTGVGTDNINFQIDSPGHIICHFTSDLFLQYSHSDADIQNNNDNDSYNDEKQY
jgi:hypothetical protein